MSDLLAGLTKEQEKAVTYGDGPVLVVAGAGTGKTTVITRRIAWLIEQKLAKPSEILALTFTEKAAAEMVSRVDDLSEFLYSDLSISTFHSFGADLISEFAFELGLPADFKVITDIEQLLFIRDHIFDFEFNHYQNLAEPTSLIRELTKLFSRCKDEMITPEKWINLASAKLKKVKGISRQARDKIADSAAILEEAEKELELANAYCTYQNLLRSEGYIDYGDQIMLVSELLKKPSIAKKIRNRYKFALVDEFQDTNFAQNEVIRQIFGEDGNVMVVGDDDQCLPGCAIISTKEGEKRIDKIKTDDLVLSAIGRGHIGLSRVSKVFKKKKKTIHITFQLDSGENITVTENHKMFCRTPERASASFYVYLMESKELGYRIGITNFLGARLRQERMADRIIAIKDCYSLDEAIYFENLYSLKYRIPKVCFRDRNGNKYKTVWLEKIFLEIDTRKAAAELARDLGIDLGWHHLALSGVTTGAKDRSIIRLEICNRAHRVKDAKNRIIKAAQILHLLSFETSSNEIIQKLQNSGFRLSSAKKGMRFREASVDLDYLSKKAQEIAEITGGIFECIFKVGTDNVQHKNAVCLPASNVLRGMLLPVLKENQVVYASVISVEKKIVEENVYDLEIEKTHNFIANGVVVHNSIYKFRGAAISNILTFRDTYKNVQTIVLTENFRSTQGILDTAYKSIQNNNPNRLEAKYQINKKLVSAKGKGEDPSLILAETESQEAEVVAEEIKKLNSGGIEFAEMAILTRSNGQTEEFVRTLKKHGIPFVFSGAAGLYERREVKMLVALTTVLFDPDDSLALYHVASSDVYNMNADELSRIARFAAKRNVSLAKTFADLESLKSQLELSEKTIKLAEKILGDLSTLREESKTATAGEVINLFLRQSGYYADLTRQAKDGVAEAHVKISNIAAFFDKIIHFQRNYKDHSLEKFGEYLSLMIDSGDDPRPFEPTEGLEVVNVLTIHKSKGLEFEVVFVSSLSDSHMPGRGMSDRLKLPEDLLAESKIEGDDNVSEERRLFYVAATRAKKHLYFTAALDYGTKKSHKVSRFITEALGTEKVEKRFLKTEPIERIKHFEKVTSLYHIALDPIPETEKLVLSRAAIDDFLTCPFKYQLVHITPIRIVADANVAYGNAIHNTIGEYYKRRIAGKKVELSQVFEWFDLFWDEAGFLSKKHEKARYENGKKALERFFAEAEKKTLPQALEKEFKFTLGNNAVIGRYDAVFDENGEVSIVDFKTSNIKTQKEADERTKKSTQLATYALSWKKATGKLPASVHLHFVDTGIVGTYVPSEKDAAKTEEEIAEAIKGIRAREYKATPGLFVCKYCPYKFYCPEAILEKVQS